MLYSIYIRLLEDIGAAYGIMVVRMYLRILVYE